MTLNIDDGMTTDDLIESSNGLLVPEEIEFIEYLFRRITSSHMYNIYLSSDMLLVDDFTKLYNIVWKSNKSQQISFIFQLCDAKGKGYAIINR